MQGITHYKFAIQNSLPVEAVLVTDSTTDWNDRLRFQIPANATTADMNVLLTSLLIQKDKNTTRKN
jgi:hypothetical protein